MKKIPNKSSSVDMMSDEEKSSGHFEIEETPFEIEKSSLD